MSLAIKLYSLKLFSMCYHLVQTTYSPNRILQKIIGQYNPSVRIINLVSHTTYVVCVNFIYKWHSFHGNCIYSESFCQKSSEWKSPKKCFSYFVLMSGLVLDPGFTCNKPTHHLQQVSAFAPGAFWRLRFSQKNTKVAFISRWCFVGIRPKYHFPAACDGFVGHLKPIIISNVFCFWTIKSKKKKINKKKRFTLLHYISVTLYILH